MRTSVHIVARSALTAGSALALAAGLLTAQPAAMAAPTPVAAVPPAATATLKRLPAGHDELVFRGENAARAWQVYLSPTEAARISSFQLGLLNSVVDLPDRSSVKLTINGRALAAAAVRSPDEITNVAVKIPPGVLLPGANTVQVNVALTHRVDCSVGATYELWALLDPARTGFVVDNVDSYAIRSLDELAAEPLAEDGATHIHVRMQDFADPDSVGRAARFVDALVRRAGLARSIVDVGPEAGQGPGFDVVLFSGQAPDMGPGGAFYLDTYSSLESPSRTVLHAGDGQDLGADPTLEAVTNWITKNDQGKKQIGWAMSAQVESVAATLVTWWSPNASNTARSHATLSPP